MIYKEDIYTEEMLTDSILALRRSYEAFHPEQELVILSLPKSDPQQRTQILARAMELFADA